MEKQKLAATREKLAGLEAKKRAAISKEDYIQADKLKKDIEVARREEAAEANIAKVAELDEMRTAAVAAEDFIRADELKKEIAVLRRQVSAEEKQQEVAKKKAAEKEAPTQEELKQHGPSGYKQGQFVEIFGLESAEGKKLNGQKGRITRYIYEKIRYEIALSGGKKVSARPMNLKEAAKLDAKWTYGNTCRLVSLREDEDEGLREANGCLGTLTSRNFKSASWKVISNGKIHSVNWENLQVCTDEEENLAFGYASQMFQSFVAFATVHVLLGVVVVVLKIEMPELFNNEQGEDESGEEGLLRMVLNPTIPSTYAAGLCGATVAWSFLVLWGTVFACCKMHRSLWDPTTTFPQIAELSVGRNSAKTVFRLGFGMVAALLLGSVVLYKEVVLPHLPPAGTGPQDALFWGIVAVVGVAVQAAVLVEVSYSWQTLLHRFGMVLVIVAAYKFQVTTMQLYLPGVRTATETWLHMLLEYLPDRELAQQKEQEYSNAELIKTAQEFVSTSKFLAHPAIQTAVIIRYNVLSYWPWLLLMLPVLSSVSERGGGPDKSGTVPPPSQEKADASAATLWRSMFAWCQWLLTLVCSLMLLSYAPDLIVASSHSVS